MNRHTFRPRVRCAGLATALAFALSACASVPTRVTVQPSAAAVPSGVLAMDVTVTNRGRDCRGEPDACAIRAALEHVLFRGVPGSVQPTAMIADERAARQRHATYLDGLVRKDSGRQFVVSTTPVPRAPDTFTIALHHSRLRDALVREGIIRRFGY